MATSAQKPGEEADPEGIYPASNYALWFKVNGKEREVFILVKSNTPRPLCDLDKQTMRQVIK